MTLDRCPDCGTIVRLATPPGEVTVCLALPAEPEAPPSARLAELDEEETLLRRLAKRGRPVAGLLAEIARERAALVPAGRGSEFTREAALTAGQEIVAALGADRAGRRDFFTAILGAGERLRVLPDPGHHFWVEGALALPLRSESEVAGERSAPRIRGPRARRSSRCRSSSRREFETHERVSGRFLTSRGAASACLSLCGSQTPLCGPFAMR